MVSFEVLLEPTWHWVIIGLVFYFLWIWTGGNFVDLRSLFGLFGLFWLLLFLLFLDLCFNIIFCFGCLLFQGFWFAALLVVQVGKNLFVSVLQLFNKFVLVLFGHGEVINNILFQLFKLENQLWSDRIFLSFSHFLDLLNFF